MRKLGFDLRVPVIQAPMAGGTITTPELVAAVSNAGGLGTLAAGYLTAAQIERVIGETRKLTARPFAINLFVPSARLPLAGDVETQMRLLAPIHERLGIAPPSLSGGMDSFDDQLAAVIAGNVGIVSFTFGMLPENATRRLRDRGVYLMGTATTVDEARQLEASGVDAIVAQGSEAGAHRGTFSVPPEPPLVGTIALVPQIFDAVRLPVIASGGIMDGRGIVAALALGASAVQMGTAFLTCEECGAPAAHKQAVREASEDATALTRAFSGRWARGIRNQFLEHGRSAEPLTYPSQNTLTSPMRAAAARQGDRELLALWAGQGTRMARPMPAAALMAALESEIKAVVQRVSSLPV